MVLYEICCELPHMYIDQAFINRTGAHLNLPSIMHRTHLSKLNAGERLDQGLDFT